MADNEREFNLPDGFNASPLREEDIPDAMSVLIAHQIATSGSSDMTLDDFRGDLEGVDLESETLLIRSADGRAAAYVDIDNKADVTIGVYGYAHPDFAAEGIGDTVIDWGESWAERNLPNAPADARVVVRHFTHSADADFQELLHRHAYVPIRTSFVMGLVPASQLVEPVWPEGISVRTFVPGEDERVTFEAHEDAFQDLWGRPRGTFEKFLATTRRPYFDPTLWFLVMDGADVAGIALTSDIDGNGWIENVGVRRPWRGRGIGLAMLRHAIAALASRGVAKVELSVDAESPTGATRLYERAGMHVLHRYVLFQKEIRDGRDLTTFSEADGE